MINRKLDPEDGHMLWYHSPRGLPPSATALQSDIPPAPRFDREIGTARRFISASSVTVLLLAGSIQTGLAVELPNPVPCSPCFIGQLMLIDNVSDATGKTKMLADDLYFVDDEKYVWKAGKSDVTDGASIPSLFKPIIGGSFEADFVPAAVIHDHYTNRAHRVRTWRDTARVFYQAMLVNGVNVIKAKTMYFAVYTFGPHWGVLAKGVPCGARCTFTVPEQLAIATGGNIVATGVPLPIAEGRVYAEETANYSDTHVAELNDIQRKIEASEVRGAPLSLKDLNSIATLNHGENVFLLND